MVTLFSVIYTENKCTISLFYVKIHRK